MFKKFNIKKKLIQKVNTNNNIEPINLIDTESIDISRG
jgi:hypothetical protein